MENEPKLSTCAVCESAEWSISRKRVWVPTAIGWRFAQSEMSEKNSRRQTVPSVVRCPDLKLLERAPAAVERAGWHRRLRAGEEPGAACRFCLGCSLGFRAGFRLALSARLLRLRLGGGRADRARIGGRGCACGASQRRSAARPAAF